MKRRVSGVVLLSLILLSLTGCGNTEKAAVPRSSVSRTESSSSKTASSSQAVTSSSQTASSSQTVISSLSAASSPEPVSSSQEATAETGREGFSILEISDDLFYSMKAGNTYKSDCIVPREDLRYLLVLHKDKDGITHQGEMVVHKLIAEDVLEIFEALYKFWTPGTVPGVQNQIRS